VTKSNAIRYVAAAGLFALATLAWPRVSLSQEEIPFEISAAYASIKGGEILDFIRLIASDKFKGRGTGSDQYYQAALLMAGTMKEAGFTPFGGKDTFLQPYEIEQNRIYAPWAFEILHQGKVILSPALGQDFVFRGFTATGDVTADAVFCGYGLSLGQYDDYSGVDARGKAVVVLNGLPKSLDVEANENYKFAGYKMRNAAQHGAAAIIFVGDTGEDYGAPAASVFRGPYPGKPDLVAVKVGMKAATALVTNLQHPLSSIREIIDSETKPMSFPLETSVHIVANSEYFPKRTAYNVVGLKRGSNAKLRNRYILICAHMDHVGEQAGVIFNGADDNASGTGVLRQIAKAFGMATRAPRRSIILVAFSGEEMGLLGSNHFVENPPVPLGQIDAVINMDMVGMGDLAVVFGGTNHPQIYSAFSSFAETAGIKIAQNGANPASDQRPFVAKGVPAVMVLTAGDRQNYHTPGDDAELLNPQLMEDVAQLVFLSAWTLADW
jgi:Zn-dependent M28 family amino/carboxypeptidase